MASQIFMLFEALAQEGSRFFVRVSSFSLTLRPGVDGTRRDAVVYLQHFAECGLFIALQRSICAQRKIEMRLIS